VSCDKKTTVQGGDGQIMLNLGKTRGSARVLRIGTKFRGFGGEGRVNQKQLTTANTANTAKIKNNLTTESTENTEKSGEKIAFAFLCALRALRG
jgi:hypothetical protein